MILGIGLVTGIAGALVLGRWLSSLVFQVSPWDPRILAATALLLSVTGLARRVAACATRLAGVARDGDDAEGQ